MNRRKDLTGRIALRPSLTGKLVVQVECRAPDDVPGDFHCWWADARAGDLAQLFFDRPGVAAALVELFGARIE